jgi:hypothetical protein
MKDFCVTKDRRVFLGETEIEDVLGFSVVAEALEDPEVILRVGCKSISIEGYTNPAAKQMEVNRCQTSGS